ncbi:hypothetical protein L596_014667 [Steinernema carpocapsae]|uniref:Uncharacterized protein n=1 Tax=Steinernema carpocapsae TaxID=34508 RepID=A0A4U5NCJ8_STECR|nr:hypothetical protein L596_014667 [Steinernema carpocapsae]
MELRLAREERGSEGERAEFRKQLGALEIRSKGDVALRLRSTILAKTGFRVDMSEFLESAARRSIGLESSRIKATKSVESKSKQPTAL